MLDLLCCCQSLARAHLCRHIKLEIASPTMARPHISACQNHTVHRQASNRTERAPVKRVALTSQGRDVKQQRKRWYREISRYTACGVKECWRIVGSGPCAPIPQRAWERGPARADCSCRCALKADVHTLVLDGKVTSHRHTCHLFTTRPIRFSLAVLCVRTMLRSTLQGVARLANGLQGYVVRI